jgi:hypothetical protein
MNTQALQIGLGELEAFDAGAPSSGTERRFCCPFCGDGKPKDAAHRSMGINTQSGAFVCHRCHASGLLTEFWTRTPTTRQTRRKADLARAFPLSHQIVDQERAVPLAFDSEPLAGTPGAAYLLRRGVSIEVAHAAGVSFSSDWFGRAAVMFPLYDHDGIQVAAQGRYTDTRTDPKTRTFGRKKHAVFTTPTLDGFGPFDAKSRSVPFIVTEAPLDALSLAVAGFPAVALCGTTGPQWLRVRAALKPVFLAFDADQAGDDAADELTPTLESFGATCQRLRPEGAKDWNEMLCEIGRDALADFIIGEQNRRSKST